MRRRVPLLLAAIALTLAAAPHASAAPSIKFGLTDDAWLVNGPGTLDARLAKLDALGVRGVRFTLRWDQTARTRPTVPADLSAPAYNWGVADPVLDGLKQHGVEVVLQLVGTPGWANGRK